MKSIPQRRLGPSRFFFTVILAVFGWLNWLQSLFLVSRVGPLFTATGRPQLCQNTDTYGGGGVICLRFAVFGHFLRGYLRFRGFWALFLRFCGFGKTAAVCGFWPYLHAVLRFQVILFAVLRYQCILFCDFIDLTYIHLWLCSTGVSLLMNNVFHAILMMPLMTYAQEPGTHSHNKWRVEVIIPTSSSALKNIAAWTT